MSTGLGREDTRALLDDLSGELAARGARAEHFLVGGAALAVAYDATRATRDLDAVFIPTDVGQHVVIDSAGAAVTPSLGLGGAQPVVGALADSEPGQAGGQRVARDPAPGSAKPCGSGGRPGGRRRPGWRCSTGGSR